MMNEETKPGMNADEFEKRLQRQPLRQTPCEWRSEILAAARDAQASCYPSPATRHGWLATFNFAVAASESVGGAGGSLDFCFCGEFFPARTVAPHGGKIRATVAGGDDGTVETAADACRTGRAA